MTAHDLGYLVGTIAFFAVVIGGVQTLRQQHDLGVKRKAIQRGARKQPRTARSSCAARASC